MIIVISTQIHENYAAHDWDGESDCPQYWKAKGGSEYVFTGLEGPLDSDITSLVDSLIAREGIESSDDYYVEYVIDWTVEADDYQTTDEQNQLEWDGAIRFPSPRIAI